MASILQFGRKPGAASTTGKPCGPDLSLDVETMQHQFHELISSLGYLGRCLDGMLDVFEAAAAHLPDANPGRLQIGTMKTSVAQLIQRLCEIERAACTRVVSTGDLVAIQAGPPSRNETGEIRRAQIT
jgi:hypothetical protein